MLAVSEVQAQQNLPTVKLGFVGPSVTEGGEKVTLEEGDTIKLKISRDIVTSEPLEGIAVYINQRGPTVRNPYIKLSEIGYACPGFEHLEEDRCFTIPASKASVTVDIPTYPTTSFEHDAEIIFAARGGLPEYYYRNHYRLTGNTGYRIYAMVRDGPDVKPEVTTVTLSVGDARAAEGNSSDPATLSLKLSKLGVRIFRGLTAGQSLRVPLVFSGGQPGTDFRLAMLGAPNGVAFDAATSTVTFKGPSAAEVFLELLALDDADADDETVTVAVPKPVASGITGTVEGRRRGNGQIRLIDDGEPTDEQTGPTPLVAIVAAAGGTEGAAATFTIQANRALKTSLPVSVTVDTVGDFGVAAGKRTVTIPARGIATLTLPTTDDSTDEADGSITVTVNAGDGYTVLGSRSSRTVSILDNDEATNEQTEQPEVTIAADAASKTEGGDASFTLTADPKPGSALSVSVTVATSGNYGVTAGKRTVTIPASGSAKLRLSTTNDDADEADGSVTVTVNAGDGYTVGSPSSATVSILDDDDPPLPEVTIAADAASKTEGGDASFTLTADPKPAAALAVSVTVATSGDYGVTAGKRTVTIPASGSAKLRLSTTNDDADEADGSVTVTVNAGDGYTVGSPSSATVSILDDDDPPLPRASFASGSQSAVESAGTRTVTVNLSPAPQAGVTLNYTVGGTAASGADYKALSGRAAVSAGAGSVDIPVVLTDDSADEANETVVLTLTAGSGYAVANPSVHTLTILDDDDPPLPRASFASGSQSAVESAGTRTVTVNLSPAPQAGVTLNYTVGGTAASGADYKALSGRAAVSAGAGSVDIPVVLTDDSADEANETVVLTLTAGSGYALANPSVHTLTITDDDDPPLPEVTIAADAASKTEGGDASFTLTADPKPASSLAVSVTVATSGGYGVTAGKRTVTIPASGSAKLRLSTTNDDADEADGSVTVTVNAGDGYTVGSASSATVSITDDDAPLPPGVDAELVANVRGYIAEPNRSAEHVTRWQRVLLALGVESYPGLEPMTAAEARGYVERGWTRWIPVVDALAAIEGPPPTPEVTIAADAASKTEGGDASFTLTADPPPASSLSVSVTVATSGDYGVTAGKRTVTIPASGSAKLRLSTTNDDADEADGSVTVTVNAGDGYTVGSPSSATVSILDDDDPPLPEVTIAADAASKTEGGDASFTLTADPKPGSALSVSVTVATSGNYGVTAGKRTVTIPASGSAKLTLSTTDDSADEADGSVSAAVGTGDGYTVGSPSLATVSILDDDDPPLPEVTIAADAASKTEGGDASFTLTADPPPASSLSVSVTVATSGDYGVTAGKRTVTIPASGSAKLTLSTTDDSTEEADGSVTVTVGAGDGYTVGNASSGTVSILDDDAPLPEVTIAADAGSTTEGGNAAFTLTANPRPAAALSVRVTVATAGDYGVTAGSQTVTIPTTGSAKLRLSTTNDDADEADGSVTVTVHAGDGYTVGSASSGTVSITDDDDAPQPEVTIAADAASKTEGGDASFTLTADPKPAAALAVSVTVATSGDYGVTAGKRTVTIPASGSAKLTLSTTDDSTEEADGSVTVTVGAGDGYTVGNASSGTVSILDDDAPLLPVVSLGEDLEAPEHGLFVFRVTLSAAVAHEVRVKWFAEPETARYADFEPISGTVWFLPGEREGQFVVFPVDDSHDEGKETFRVELRDAEGATIGDGVAVGTIVNSDPMPSGWLARFGRTVAQEALDGIAARIEAPRVSGARGAVAGYALGPSGGAGAADAELQDPGTGWSGAPARGGPAAYSRAPAGGSFGAGIGNIGGGTADHSGVAGYGGDGLGSMTAPVSTARSVSLGDLLLGSRFTYTSGADRAGGTLGFRSRGSRTRFAGRAGDLGLDGEVTAGLLGADYARNNWLLGVALTQSSGGGGYRSSGGDAATDGAIRTSLTAAIPYASWRASERLGVWGAAGYGAGGLTLKPEGGETLETEIGWTMAAAGLKSDLFAFGGVSLALVSDALWARTSSDRTEGLAATDGAVSRLRLGLEGSSRTFELPGGGSVRPKLEFGARYDGGGAETGFGVELGGGVAWTDPRLGLRLDVEGRMLILHDDGAMRDRGLSASLAYDPEPNSARGLSLVLRQDIGGASSGGLNALFASDRLTRGTRGYGDYGINAGRWTAEMGYGASAFRGRFTGTPHVGYAVSPDARELGAGWRLESEMGPNGLDLGLAVQTARRELLGQPADHAVGIEFRTRW